MERAWGNQYRTTRVCVDDYTGDVLKGRVDNPILKAPLAFSSMSQFLLCMEEALDQMNFPQSFAVSRSFAPQSFVPSAAFRGSEKTTGALATFAVRVLFRQNASWQGSVTWEEAEREQNFRSALELLMMLDGALKEAKNAR